MYQPPPPLSGDATMNVELLNSLYARKVNGEKTKALASEAGLSSPQALVAAWKKAGVGQAEGRPELPADVDPATGEVYAELAAAAEAQAAEPVPADAFDPPAEPEVVVAA